MAFRPSFRRTTAGEDIEPNLTPVMNLMVVLIPLLLSSAQWIKIGVIELNLPPAVGTKTVVGAAPKETEKKLDLAVTITDRGFYLSSSQAILKSSENNGPTIPNLADGSYDYDALANKLLEIKQSATGRYSDTERIVIQAEPDINYQVLVSTMDSSRKIVVDGREVILFPDVSLAAGVI
ncbi:MAG: biopolymer transporter ExbD [candidate division KSB1 bacterium]|jgi:biopolymer transport protein ExbD|nr:biopolymer transporter ExbD [candidate division KSB1 bacterium]